MWWWRWWRKQSQNSSNHSDPGDEAKQRREKKNRTNRRNFCWLLWMLVHWLHYAFIHSRFGCCFAQYIIFPMLLGFYNFFFVSLISCILSEDFFFSFFCFIIIWELTVALSTLLIKCRPESVIRRTTATFELVQK